MIANSHGTAKQGVACSRLRTKNKMKLDLRAWNRLSKEKNYSSEVSLTILLVPLEKGKFNWKVSPSSCSWVSFLGCLHQCSVLFIKITYPREPWHCGVQREERIVHAFAWFRNWLHQNNAPCLISLFNVKYGRQHKLNYTSILLASSLAKKLNLLLKHWNCGSGGSRPSDNGWGGSFRPWDKGGWSQKNCFSALQASVWSSNKGVGPPGPSPGSATVWSRHRSIMCWVFSLGTIKK